MMKQARCTNICRLQRGDALLEALIGVLLLAILGLGLSYSAARMLSSQRYAATHSIVVAQMRNAVQTLGLEHLCSNSFTISITTEQGGEVSVVLPAAQCERHDVEISADDPALSVTLPQAAITSMVFSTEDSGNARDLLGPGSIVLSQ
ncbi:MAG: hypothetical protein KBF33_07855 [Comamonas sp.]|nr:hypothetical protein [Comamonas sp.]